MAELEKPVAVSLKIYISHFVFIFKFRLGLGHLQDGIQWQWVNDDPVYVL